MLWVRLEGGILRHTPHCVCVCVCVYSALGQTGRRHPEAHPSLCVRVCVCVCVCVMNVCEECIADHSKSAIIVPSCDNTPS